MPLIQDVLHRQDVAEGLGHLAPLRDQQMLDVHPEPRERLARRPLGLRDLVLVVGKDEVDAPGVDVDGRPVEQTQRHGRALDVPPGSSWSDPEVPGRLVRPGRLPEHEVAGILLVVLVAVDACAGTDPLVVELRELAVVGQGVDLEVDRAIAPIGVTTRLERLDHLDHGAEVDLVGRPWIVLDPLQTERRRILEERVDVSIGVLAQRDPGLA